MKSKMKCQESGAEAAGRLPYQTNDPTQMRILNGSLEALMESRKRDGKTFWVFLGVDCHEEKKVKRDLLKHVESNCLKDHRDGHGHPGVQCDLCRKIFSG